MEAKFGGRVEWAVAAEAAQKRARQEQNIRNRLAERKLEPTMLRPPEPSRLREAPRLPRSNTAGRASSAGRSCLAASIRGGS